MIILTLEPLTEGHIDHPVNIKPKQEKIIGRSYSCDIVLLHREVSRKHCKIVNDGKQCTILDLGSVNGFTVNNERIANKVLVDGDTIAIGNIEFSVAITDSESLSDSSVQLIEKEEDSKVIKRLSFQPTRIMGETESPADIESLRKAHSNLSFITKIANLTFDADKIEENLADSIKTIAEFFKADRGCILILNTTTKKIEPKAIYTKSGDTDSNIGISKTIVNESIEKGLSVLSSDVGDDSRFRNSDSIVNLNISSVMCVPLEGKIGIVGVIYIDTLGSNTVFSEEDLKILNTIGYQIGAGIQQQWLEQDLTKSKKELEEYSRLLEAKVNERTSRLTQMIEKLRESDKLKSQFLATMSHELRTPLNAIVGFGSLIQDRVYGEITLKQEEAIIKIKKNAENLLSLINSILDISRIDAGRMPLFLDDFSPNEAIQEVIESFKSLLKNEVKIELNLDNMLADVYNDRGKFEQIIRNLFTNAMKFTLKGKITVSTRIDKQKNIFETSIKDTGVGIPKDKLSKIFSEFFQVDGSKTRKYEGSGLGLAICHRLANLMGGTIEVASRVNKGSDFEVCIPVDIRDVIEEAEKYKGDEKEKVK